MDLFFLLITYSRPWTIRIPDVYAQYNVLKP